MKDDLEITGHLWDDLTELAKDCGKVMLTQSSEAVTTNSN